MKKTLDRVQSDGLPRELNVSRAARFIAPSLAIAVLPLTYFVYLRGLLPGTPTAWISFTLLSVATIASVTTALMAQWEGISRDSAVRLAIRFGIRIGTFVFLLGAAMAIFAVSIQLIQARLQGLDLPNRLRSWLPVVFVSLSACPTIAAAAIGALSIATSRTPPPTHSHPPKQLADIHRKRTAIYGTPTYVALLVFLLSCATTLIPPQVRARDPNAKTQSRPDPVTAIQEDPIPPAPVPPETPSAQPRYTYTTPPNFETVDASQLTYGDHLTIPDLDPTGPVAFSPDGSLIAFRTRSDGAVQVFDPHHRETFKRIQPSSRFSSICWSPDIARLALVSDSRENQFQVVDLDPVRNYVLPAFDMRIDSQTFPVWLHKNQLILASPTTPAFAIELDLLRIAACESPTLSLGHGSILASDENDYRFRSIVETSGFELSVIPRIYSATRDAREDSVDLELLLSDEVCLVSKINGKIRRDSGITLHPQDHFLPSPNGTMVLQLTAQEGILHYLVSHSRTFPKFTIASPTFFNLVEGSKIDHLKSSGKLHVLLYPSLQNPLNDKPIGPDRPRVVAIGKLSTVDEKLAELELIDMSSIPPGNLVASDLHYWEDGHPIFIRDDKLDKWWALATPQKGKAASQASELIEYWHSTTLTFSRSGLHADPARPFATSQAVRARYSRYGLISRTHEESRDPPETGRPPRPMITGEILARFINQHHQKASNKDLDGYISDYAEWVQYYSQGLVSRKTIREDQRAYFPKYASIKEDPQGELKMKRLVDGSMRAEYSLLVDAIRIDGTRSSKLFGSSSSAHDGFSLESR